MSTKRNNPLNLSARRPNPSAFDPTDDVNGSWPDRECNPISLTASNEWRFPNGESEQTVILASDAQTALRLLAVRGGVSARVEEPHYMDRGPYGVASHMVTLYTPTERHATVEKVLREARIWHRPAGKVERADNPTAHEARLPARAANPDALKPVDTVLVMRPDGSIDYTAGSVEDAFATVEESGGVPVMTTDPLHDARESNPSATASFALKQSMLPVLDVERILADAKKPELLELAFKRVRAIMLAVSPAGTQRYDTWSELAKAIWGSNLKISKNEAGGDYVAYGLQLQPHKMALGRTAPSGVLKTRARKVGDLQVEEVYLDENGPLLNWSDILDPHDSAQAKRLKFLQETPTGASWCVGSTDECRSLCLVYSGQQTQEQDRAKRGSRVAEFARHVPYNYALKKARATALLAWPHEFMVVLLAGLLSGVKNVEKANRKKGTDVRVTVRLNVLQDIPWELVVPGLFTREEFALCDFYDYTKIVGRWRGYQDRTQGVIADDVYDRYRLTFSYSGGNLRECVQALDHVNVAAPILGLLPGGSRQQEQDVRKALVERERPVGRDEAMRSVELIKRGGAAREKAFRWVGFRTSEKGKRERANIELPDSVVLGGRARPMVDGDRTDLRFLDDPQSGALVGLRFKMPLRMMQQAGDLADVRFILKGTLLPSGDGRHQWVIGAETPACPSLFATPESAE